MKIKITITGPKVHDVGYRPHLTEMAMRLALRGFEVYNDEEDGQQAVIALVEADEQRIKRFHNSAMKERPQLAVVDKVRSEDYTGDVIPLWQFASINSASQMNKAIPILLEMRDNLQAVKTNTDTIPQMREDLEAIKTNTNAIPQMREDLKAIKVNTGAIPQVPDEIKGLREDIQPGYAMQFRQVREDIRAIKERLGMP
jgi:acylphosphatase